MWASSGGGVKGFRSGGCMPTSEVPSAELEIGGVMWSLFGGRLAWPNSCLCLCLLGRCTCVSSFVAFPQPPAPSPSRHTEPPLEQTAHVPRKNQPPESPEVQSLVRLQVLSSCHYLYPWPRCPYPHLRWCHDGGTPRAAACWRRGGKLVGGL